MRVVGGRLRSRPIAGPKSDALAPDRRPAARSRCSTFSRMPTAIRLPARACSTCSPAPARSASRRSRAARPTRCSSTTASQARALLRDNTEPLGLGGVTRIFRRDATKLGPAHPLEPFTLAFLDPPYRKGLAEKALASARDGGWLDARRVDRGRGSGGCRVQGAGRIRGIGAARIRRYGAGVFAALTCVPGERSEARSPSAASRYRDGR